MDPSHTGPDFVVVGPLRAGTTMLRLMLDNHPNIACVGEFEEAVSQCGDVGWPDVSWYRRWLSQDRASIAKRFCIDDAILEYPSLVRSMWRQLAARSSKMMRGCTIHSRFDRVRDIWPGSKFIFLLRDPRDVAASCVSMGWIGEATHGVRYWLDPVRRWRRLRDQLHPDEFVEIRYEELLREPDSTLARCCGLLGLRFDPKMLEFHQRSTYQPIDPSLAGQWQRRLTPRTAEFIEAACLGPMQDFGYECSVATPRDMRWTDRLGRAVVNRVNRLRFRGRRYGWHRTLAWAAAKHLRIDHPWRLRLRHALNEVDGRFLK